MYQNATFYDCSISIDNAEFDGKFINIDCSEFIEEKLTNSTFGERLRKSRLKLGLSISYIANSLFLASTALFSISLISSVNKYVWWYY